MKGYVQLYTGNGKGKTTAALGLALRAAGAGLRVFIAQFCKGRPYSELIAIRRFKESIQLKQYGMDKFIHGKPSEEDKELARRGLREARDALLSGTYDLVILDEATIAVHLRLITLEGLIELIDKKPLEVELVITGRYAKKSLVERADLVTRMTEVKHYYRKGVTARKGIEM